MKVRIYTGTRVSDGARALAAALTSMGQNAKVLRVGGSTWRPRAGDYVINWGSTKIKDFEPAAIINSFNGVGTAVNKIKTFKAIKDYGGQSRIPLDEAKYPRYGTSLSDLLNSLGNGRRWPQFGVIVRTTLTGHSGEGTYYCRNQADYNAQIANGIFREQDIVLCQSYVQKNAEYRVHVLGGEVIDFQKKRREAGAAEAGTASDTIRNHQNGWVYCRDNVELSERVKLHAIEAVAACGLDFGAVDIMTVTTGKPFVLEVNSAPGLSETTANKYARALVTFL